MVKINTKNYEQRELYRKMIRDMERATSALGYKAKWDHLDFGSIFTVFLDNPEKRCFLPFCNSRHERIFLYENPYSSPPKIRLGCDMTNLPQAKEIAEKMETLAEGRYGVEIDV